VPAPDLSELTFRPSPGDVLIEVFGDEAVAVHLRTGAYYAFDPEVTRLWSLLERERVLAAVADSLMEDSGRDRGSVEDEVVRFAAYLASEQLAEFGHPLPESGGPGPAEWPGITRFTDMADLLLLDPIHDIDLDGDGWPIVTSERPAGA
jgi:hypothetical protein